MTGYTGPQGTPGVSSGQLLYLNYSQTPSPTIPTGSSIANSYKLLSQYPTNVGQTMTTTIVPRNSTGTILGPTGFANNITTLNVGNFIPSGFWDMNIFAATNASAVSGSHCSIYYGIFGITGSVETLFANSSLATLTSTSPAQYSLTIELPYISLSSYSGLVVKIYGNNNDSGGGGNHPIYLYYEDTSTYSHIHTSFGALGFTGPTGPTGSKTFVIDHPNDSTKYLVHGCLEGPESGVYYRGKSQINNNIYTTIQLPEYVKNLATNFTIQITPIYSGKELKQLYTTEIKDNSFQVYGENCEFYWMVHGKRLDIEVEPLKAVTNVKGNGPYTWI